jgi:phage tail tape-measure protein
MRTGPTADADTIGTVGSAMAGGAIAGAALGTIIPVIGNVAGALIGGAIGAIGGIVATSIAGVSSDEEVEAIDKLAAAYRKDEAVLDKLA